MKTIQEIQIWGNGSVKSAKVLNAYASKINLNKDAYFAYNLYSVNDNNSLSECLSSGNLYMDEQEYQLWNTDDVAWDFIAKQLNLTITGDYVPPIIIEEPIYLNKESL